MKKITAVIVTYNRLALLKECLQAVQSQTYAVSAVVIINNASTDGTREYLDTLSDKTILIKDCEKNMGGAWGFAEGIATAARQDADAVWIMDDDTVPTADALRHLVEAWQEHPDAGFTYSRVEWTDGTEHKMNIPGYAGHDEGAQHRILRSASFVSLFVPCAIVREVGLPYRDFFIWVDDAEYTSRIFKAGHKGYQVNESIVLHKTAANYGASIKNATPDAAWKFYYYMRNGMFASRDEQPWLCWFFRHLNHLRLDLHRIKALPPDARKAFRRNLWRGFVDGLTFRPPLERL